MEISFYIGEAYFSGKAMQVDQGGETVFLVELDNQQPFHARPSKQGQWTSDHTKGNKMIYDMVCAAGSEINWRLSLADPGIAEPGYYETGCGLKDCPAERATLTSIV